MTRVNIGVYIFCICSADMSVVKANIDVLVMEGLGPRADTDFLLARDTCLALLKLGVPKTVSFFCLSFLFFFV